MSYKQINDIPYYEDDMIKHGDLGYIAERCKLDVYYPEGARYAPTILFFHGGGLSTGEKFIPELLKNHGLIVVSANYRLSSDRARCPDYLNDAAAAAAWTFRHIAEYGGDSDAVFVSGGSGGAYLAAMIGMAPQYLEQFGFSNRKFAALMPISGQMTTHFQLLNERNGTAGMTQPLRAVIDEYAPLYYASRDLSPVILYAGDPQIEWPTRAEENALLAATLTRVAEHKRTELYLFPGFNHGTVYDPAYLLMRERVFLLLGDKLRGRVKPAPLTVTRDLQWTDLQARRGGPEPFGTKASWRHDGKNLYVTVECPEPQMDKLFAGPALWDGDCIELWLENAPGSCGQLGFGADGKAEYLDWGMPAFEFKSEVVSGPNGWTVNVCVPIAALGSAPKANIIRHRVTGGENVYTNWSPVFTGVNKEPDAFVELKFE